MAILVTTLGDRTLEQITGMLPHEHVFTDIRQGEPAGFGEGAVEDVKRLVVPWLERLQEQGVNCMVECTPVGCGRRVDLMKAVSEAADFPLVVATGIYREPWVPQWAHDATLEQLYQWMRDELNEGIGDTGVRAGWIKLSAGDDGLTAVEEKILRAAARAAGECGVAIGSHTIRGSVVLRQLDVLQEEGCSPERFVWIHTQAEANREYHMEAAARGAWLEFDGIGGSPADEDYLELLHTAIDAGFGDQVLLSQDRGWYDPAHPDGSNFKPYTYLMEAFVPLVREAGLGGWEEQLLRVNPFRAFAR